MNPATEAPLSLYKCRSLIASSWILPSPLERMSSGADRHSWVPLPRSPWFVMPFIDKDCAIGFDSVLARHVGTSRQSDRVCAANSKGHSALETDSFSATHLEVRDDLL